MDYIYNIESSTNTLSSSEPKSKTLEISENSQSEPDKSNSDQLNENIYFPYIIDITKTSNSYSNLIKKYWSAMLYLLKGCRLFMQFMRRLGWRLQKVALLEIYYLKQQIYLTLVVEDYLKQIIFELDRIN